MNRFLTFALPLALIVGSAFAADPPANPFVGMLQGLARQWPLWLPLLVGALPVFAFTVIPAAAALMITERIRLTLALSVAFGVVAAAVGYYVSWTEQLPTGASMVVVASLFLVPGFLNLLRRRSA